MRAVFDIEADGLLNEVDQSRNATKIHCLCWYDIDTHQSGSFTNYADIINFVKQSDLTLIGHKIITYDIPVLEKILGIKINARLVDTLILSWTLYPLRHEHGLEVWGEEFGIEKPPIVDWKNEPAEVYVHRCTEDVKINSKLWYQIFDYLCLIYDNNYTNIGRYINYLSYKGDCAREQEEVLVKIHVPKAKENLVFLQAEKQKKFDILSQIMPPSYDYKVKSKPKIMYKKDGSLSADGKKWLNLLQEMGLPSYHLGALKLVAKTKPGNPSSHAQLKAWLFSLGWEPITFKYVKDKPKPGEDTYVSMNSNTVRAVPQIATEDGMDLCESVKDLFEVEPRLVELDSYFKINHRIGCIEGFLEEMDEQHFVKARIAGLTNTLRFKHAKPIVNMPTAPKKYWEMVRGCIVAPDENHVLCGADMSSLEDSTKQHYMYFFDPEYVMEMRTPGFDPHLDIGVRAKMLTEEEAELHKLYEKTEGKEGKSFKVVRGKAKRTNFAAVYGAGPPKIALTAKMPLPQARVLHKTYWERNKAVKRVAEYAIHKTVNGQMWLYNPVSRFWYSLRYEKDKFSTLNQGTGVYCFDTWTRHVRCTGIRIAMQYHDEIMFPLLKTQEDDRRAKLKHAIEMVNQEIKLNVPLGISVQFGDNYAAIH